jgi:two-component system, OmpR family, sensor histidine kinase PhoQ
VSSPAAVSSLSGRLLLSVSVLLLFFFGATIIVLDVAFRETGEQAQRHILDGHLMSLLAAAEPNGNGASLRLPPDLPEPRFGNPGSGLYGELRDARGNVVWRSRSAIGVDLPDTAPPTQGSSHYTEIALVNGTELMSLSLSVAWEMPNGDLAPHTFSVAESLDAYYAQIAAFRRQLLGWFAAVAIVMLFSISLVMRRLLQPLRQIEQEISEIEEGRRQALSESLPSELHGVARNVNLLIGNERARSERYRHTLGNLAHSLKTPLAAVRSVINEHPESELKTRVETQVDRMNDIVRYQLRKPASYASEGFGLTAVAVEKELKRLVEGLLKVYKDKNPDIVIDIADGAVFRGDRGDFLELAGNLLDNACKWCRSRVELHMRPHGGTGIELAVADDGRGIPEDMAGILLERGMRLDESAPGHGIGLAVVRDIAASYGGNVHIGKSPLGGAEVTVTTA